MLRRGGFEVLLSYPRKAENPSFSTAASLLPLQPFSLAVPVLLRFSLLRGTLLVFFFLFSPSSSSSSSAMSVGRRSGDFRPSLACRFWCSVFSLSPLFFGFLCSVFSLSILFFSFFMAIEHALLILLSLSWLCAINLTKCC